MEVAAASEARRFGKYTLVAKLAVGGMAEIFLARLQGDGGFEKLVCIKRILPHLAKDPQFVAMFLDEARVTARISHPNVCQVFELGEWHGSYFIAMEYLEGVPLSCFRRPDFYPAQPDPRLVAGIGIQACEGLHHAHQLKRPDGAAFEVVHRDVSPQNLFVTVDGIVKVLDFGIAKVQDASLRTSTGAMKGTYAYMAPEQLRGEKIDRRCDVFAMGIVLWETLAQRHLFKRDTDFLTFQAITNDRVPDICELRPDVPPLLGDTITRAISRDREERFPSARALGEALAQAVAPLGGPYVASALGEEVCVAFDTMLADQQSMIHVAREGGEWDLDSESPLVGHGTKMQTTPVSNIRAKADLAREEVAQYAQHAISALEGDQTPVPRGRKSAPVVAQVAAETSQPYRRKSAPIAAQRLTGQRAAELPIMDWDSQPNATLPDPAILAPPAPRPSRLPWIVALVAVAVAAVAVVMVVSTRGGSTPSTATATTTTPPPAAPPHDTVATHVEPPPPPMPPPAPPVVTPPAPPPVAPVDAAVAAVTIDAATPVTPPAPATAKTVATRPDKHPPKPPQPTAVVERPSGPPGFITIDSAPVYAVIYIDGKKIGETPLVHISLAPGRHAVRAVSQSGTRTLSITIESGKTAPARRIEW
jgi:serine/threonine-protein kinase